MCIFAPSSNLKNVYLCTILKLKIMKKLKISILSAIFIVCSNVAQTAAAQNETMVFTPQWTAQAQFAGYYVAEAKERVIEVAEKALANQQQEPKQLISIMTDAVHQFVGNAEQSDDLTMMGIQYIKK